ncbi:MAG TPA: sugar phosphate isomerase/epimerase family protein [Vicinamibacterales bacterium]|jgi:sugar phosphate isomerase/epimerase|nr:sugar phosphate isomerase/epimerase family protein [Vicinamibacterales bacterium]
MGGTVAQRSAPTTFRVGLNPYGLTYTVGLQGWGTPRANPNAVGADGFIDIARAVGARCLELDSRWLLPLDATALSALRDRIASLGCAVIYSQGLTGEPGETLAGAVRVSRAIGAELIRLHLSPVLEGARAARGSGWRDIVEHARRTLVAEAPRAADAGLDIAIEDHQDFGSEELLGLATNAGPNVGIVLDTGNPFAVGEDPIAFVDRAAPRVRHVHLKDYRAQFTAEGYRLVRCPIGDGSAPLAEMATILAPHHASLTASIECGALEARHIRLFTPGWWTGYPPRDASELGTALGRLYAKRLDERDDYRTPWERDAPGDAIVAYERNDLDRSVHNLRALGWM